MKLLNLTLVNIKRQLKNPIMIFFMILFPLGMLLFINGTGNDKLGKIGIIKMESSIESENLIDNLKNEYKIKELTGNIDENLDLIKNNEVSGIYVIQKDFGKNINEGKTPNIEAYIKENSSHTLIADNIIDKFVKDRLKEKNSEGIKDNYIQTKIEKEEINTKGKESLNIGMICYFMFLGGSCISEEIIKLKSQNVLKRMISTANTDREILGSIFISSFMIQGVLSSIAYLISIKIFNFENSNILLGILAIILSSLVSTSIIIAVTRWIKNITLASLAMVIFSVIMFFLGVINSSIDMLKNPLPIYKVGIISPFAWLFKIVETGNIITPFIILSLMSMVFFTIGSFKLRDFVKE